MGQQGRELKSKLLIRTIHIYIYPLKTLDLQISESQNLIQFLAVCRAMKLNVTSIGTFWGVLQHCY